jgi:hypothetical protein
MTPIDYRFVREAITAGGVELARGLRYTRRP